MQNPDTGNNVIRFLLALIISVLILFGLGILFVILFLPTLLVLTLFWIIFTPLIFVVGLIFAGSFLWYLARQEPIESNPNTNYSITQGKDS